MRVPKATSKTNGLVVLVALIGLVFSSAGPAAAAAEAVGAGAGGGWEYATDPAANEPPIPAGGCNDLPFQGDWIRSTFVLFHESTYDAVDATPSPTAVDAASYVGPVTITITTEPYAAAPHAAGPECGTFPLPLVPGPVELENINIDATGSPFVAGALPGGDVDCDGNDGTFTRVNTTVAFEFVVDCHIDGNVPGLEDMVFVPDVQHLVEGNMVICGIYPEPITGEDVDNEACDLEDTPLSDPNLQTPNEDDDASSIMVGTTHQAESLVEVPVP